MTDAELVPDCVDHENAVHRVVDSLGKTPLLSVGSGESQVCRLRYYMWQPDKEPCPLTLLGFHGDGSLVELN